MTGIFFAHPHTLLDQVGKVLKRVGPQKFLTSPDEEVKKVREGFVAYFFTLALKKWTGQDWWLAQYDQATRSSPDEEWINLLRRNVSSEYPFLSIWTIHLRFKKGGKEVGKAVAQRIMPLPGLRVEADTDDPEIHKRQPLPTYLEQHQDGERTYVTFKTDFIDKTRIITKNNLRRAG